MTGTPSGGIESAVRQRLREKLQRPVSIQVEDAMWNLEMTAQLICAGIRAIGDRLDSADRDELMRLGGQLDRLCEYREHVLAARDAVHAAAKHVRAIEAKQGGATAALRSLRDLLTDEHVEGAARRATLRMTDTDSGTAHDRLRLNRQLLEDEDHQHRRPR